MVMRRVEPPAGLRPVIHALLKPRWELDPKTRRFVSGRREIVPDEHLPAGTQIEYLVGRLQTVAREGLSTHEKRLSRWVQIVLPEGADAERYVSELQGWPCFAEVHAVPHPSLPSPPAMPRPR